jgi:hypothetical protein
LKNAEAASSADVPLDAEAASAAAAGLKPNEGDALRVGIRCTCIHTPKRDLMKPVGMNINSQGT